MEPLPAVKRKLFLCRVGPSHQDRAVGCPRSKLLTKFVKCRDHKNHKDSCFPPGLLNFKPRRVYLGSHLLKQYFLSTRKKKKKERGLKIGTTRTGYSVKAAFNCKWKEKPKPDSPWGSVSLLCVAPITSLRIGCMLQWQSET